MTQPSAPRLHLHPSEDDLILYQLHECPTPADQHSIQEHLELCPACAELAASIAETLRVFSADPVPVPDLDRAWSRLQPHLPTLTPAAARRPAFLRPAILAPLAGLALAALLLLAVLIPRHHARPALNSPALSSPALDPTIARLPPGPLTPRPVPPGVAAHLDSAERFLTEVSHSPAPMDAATRQQAHTLLLQNAVYVRTARSSGDFADAAVLEKLGHLLTTVDHDTDTSEPGWHLRLELSAHGLLFDLRILRQNQAQQRPGDLE